MNFHESIIHSGGELSPLSIIPFVLLILCIAFLPLINSNWWNKNYLLVTLVPSVVIVVYLLFIQRFGDLFQSFEDYIMFISFITSLYIISGGILIDINRMSTPFRNTLMLFIGALLSNIISSTGASMLLIHSYIRTNKVRINTYHIIFFIFLISNIGGVLTPIGNPPLFLGYLKGIPFFWITSRAFLPWLTAVSLLLIVFYLIDKHFYSKQENLHKSNETESREKIKVKGILNIFLLILVIVSVFISKPIFLREIIMLTSAIVSYKFTDREIYKKNHFIFEPMKEVATLFFGIFITLTPVLFLLSHSIKDLNVNTPDHYYWLTGTISAFLDNAPTYLTFLTASMGLFGAEVNNASDVLNFLSRHGMFVFAVSISSVFFGAATYIGNAPNFMIKSIAEKQGVKCVSFLGYIIRFTIPILIPLFVLIWILFIF